ncbi:MAG: PAS-domain containing protein [Bradyrhizobiaceae bacterium]|nr:PAS-domain containing protein [Bradyrhizobiaceae bacterium]
MGHAPAANATIRVHARGIARLLSRPAYQRLLRAEPVLRRAVPVLIVVFLAAVAAGAAVQIVDGRRQALADAERELMLLAAATGEHLARHLGADASAERVRAALTDALPPKALRFERRFYVSDAGGRVIAAAPKESFTPNVTFADLMGPSRALAALGGSEEAFPFAEADGTSSLAAIRALPEPLGQIAVFQTKASALARWRADSTISITLVTTTGFVLLILGFAFHWQAARAREADEIYDVARARMDTALNRGRCGLWDWDLARGRIYWSDSMFEILGYPPREELLSFGEVDALVHEDDGSLYNIARHLAETADGTIDRAFRMRHANGEWVWLRARAELAQQDGGAHVVGIAVDISEEKKFAERTATADMRLRDAVECISESFVLWDAADRLVLCNSKFQQLHELPESATVTGTPHEELEATGRTLSIVAPIKSDEKAEEGSRSFEARTADGRWLKISERRTKDGGFVSVGTDITALKRHEERLLESEKRQMATIADLRRTQQTLEMQAQQLAELAQKYSEEKTRAEEANRAKSEFLANMSHELRTPLNAIIGFSEIMESGMFGELGAEKYHEYCRDIQDSGRYLLDVINDILDMAKIEAGRLRLDLEELHVDSIVSETLRVMSLKAGEKQLDVIAEIDPGLSLRGDRRAIKQVMLNLLSNSIKFTQEGGRIAIRARESRGHALLLIEDSGIGISRSALKRLGRPFEQVESHITKTQTGSGLGLAIAKSLVEMHGGQMRIRSIESVGTTVIVRLPFHGPAAQATNVAA